MFIKLLLAALLTLPPLAVEAKSGAPVRLAVAANFSAPMKLLSQRFQAQTGHRAVISFGSTGKLYAQIRNGADFDLFLAADQQRPRLLHRAGMGPAPRTYAVGKLVLWSGDPDLISASEALTSPRVRHIAIANPKTAPYGRGAMQILEALRLRQRLESKLVRGENIAQAYQFVATGNAELGFVAASQVNDTATGSRWHPPQSMYAPLKQDALLLTRGEEHPAALAFLEFLLSPESCQLIKAFGYGCGTPQTSLEGQ